MEKHKSARRDFIKMSALAFGGVAISPAIGVAHQATKFIPINPEEKKLNIVCVGAHPGDPEFGCGGTMAKYSDAGHQVTFLYLTRGEASDPKKLMRKWQHCEPKRQKACRILNAKPEFAGQIDGNTILDKSKNEEMAKLILPVNPDIVFTQWPVDAHPDHQVTGLLALTAWVKSNRQFHLYFYEVNTGVETMGFTPTDYVDITTVRERKKQPCLPIKHKIHKHL